MKTQQLNTLNINKLSDAQFKRAIEQNKIEETGIYLTPDTGYIVEGQKEGADLGERATAEGYNNTASGRYSHAEGDGNTVTEQAHYAHIEGTSGIVGGAAAHVEGGGCAAFGLASHAEGDRTIAFDEASHAEGNSSKAFSELQVYLINLDPNFSSDSAAEFIQNLSAEGWVGWKGSANKFLVAKGLGTHAEGTDTLAVAEQAHAEGLETVADGIAAHAEGYHTRAAAKYSHAEGQNTSIGLHGYYIDNISNTSNIIALTYAQARPSPVDNYNGRLDLNCNYEVGDSLVVNLGTFGESTYTIKTINGCNIEFNEQLPTYTYQIQNQFSTQFEYSVYCPAKPGIGPAQFSNLDDCVNSHAEGLSTLAQGAASHAEGNETEAAGNYSHAEGTQGTAYGEASHTEGIKTYASGDYSHAEGGSTKNASTVTHSYDSNLIDLSDDADIISAWEYDKFALAKGAYSHTEGLNNLALGDYSHAEGQTSLAQGAGAHTEGSGRTGSNGERAHAEGFDTLANAEAAHAEGCGSQATGEYSHAEGDWSAATKSCAHAEGCRTTASGEASHTEGSYTIATGNQSHAEGQNTTAYGSASHAEGNSANKAVTVKGIDLTDNNNITTTWSTTKFSLAKGVYSHVEGDNCLALGSCAHAEGSVTKALGSCAHAEGSATVAAAYSHAEGQGTAAAATYSHAEGQGTQAGGQYSHAEGYKSIAAGSASHAEGYNCGVAKNYSHAEGYYTTAAMINQHVQGHYNTASTVASSQTGTAGDAFIIGNGTGNAASSRSNAFRVTYAGGVYAKAAYSATGADYAEYFEWLDGNLNNEDRRGYFVTMDGEKIKFAKPGDYILGIVSGLPAIIGNSDEEWRGRYIMDEFGDFITEEFEYEETLFDEETQEEKTVTKIGTRYKQNPDYDPSKTYISRQDRPEWSAVGMMGVLSVRDDGTCQVNGYCQVAEGGIATAAETGYRVIKRVNDHIVKVIFR